MNRPTPPSTKRLTTVSKYLSKHLRHQPQAIGLTLAAGGWVSVNDLLTACSTHGFPISRDELQTVVLTNDKQRFSLDVVGDRIRANQGHSTPVDLQLEAVVPPEVLYHGTGESSVAAILQTGLCKMTRHHVHLSADVAVAKTVGSRHGRPVVLQVDARTMHTNGFTFYRSANGVWLVDHVPCAFLSLLEPG